jgi:hypothetical protein
MKFPTDSVFSLFPTVIDLQSLRSHVQKIKKSLRSQSRNGIVKLPRIRQLTRLASRVHDSLTGSHGNKFQLEVYLVVWATRRFFLADLDGFWSSGFGPPSGRRRCRCVSSTRRCPASWPFSSTAGSLFLGGLCFSVVCFFSFLGSQSACVGFNFYENICWLIAKSSLFSLESER